MEAILSLGVALLVFVPAAFFFLGGNKDQAVPAEDVAEPDGGSTGDVHVDITVVRKVTRVALGYVKTVIGGGGQRPEILPGNGSGGDDPGPGAAPSRAPRPGAEDLDGLEDLDDLADALRGDDSPGTWVDVERVRDPKSSAPGPELPPVLAPDTELPPARSAPELQAAPERDALPSDAGPAITAAGVEDDPVTLEGVDMSKAPAVRGDGGQTATRLPTVGQLQAALATGGFNRLMAWLRAFRKASTNTLQQANALHMDALSIARRTRTKYALALQAFQAVQSDGLDRATIARVFGMLQQAEREAVAAAAATHHTAALVVAAGGSQPAVAAAINTLQRNHGDIAAAVQAAPRPVRDIRFYQQ